VTAGEYVECLGFWVNDRQHGQQFKTTVLKVVAPTTLDGIENPRFAKKVIAALGAHVFDVIEQTPEWLLELAGIGKKRQERGAGAWSEPPKVPKR
jgi:exodeoxyribonuclease V alpha subunit